MPNPSALAIFSSGDRVRHRVESPSTTLIYYTKLKLEESSLVLFAVEVES